MTGSILILLGLACASGGWFLLRRRGTGWRIGRLLSAAPQRDLATAATLAAADEQAYVRIRGRVESEEEFPGDDGKPLVFRRRRLQHRSGRSGWRTFDEERLAVPFGLTERGVRVAIDIEALGDGLVVVPREAEGVATDVGEADTVGPRPDLAPDTPVRLRIDQVSAVDHATAAGVPRPGPDGQVVLGPGLGRPLLLTTLELDEAMRVLAGEQRGSLLVAAALIVAAPICIVLGLAMLALGS